MRKDIFFYLRKCIAFFDIKAKVIPPVVFLCILALYALYFYIVQIDTQSLNLVTSQYMTPEGATVPVQTSVGSMALGVVVMLLINIVSFIYLDAATRDAKNQEYAARDCINSAMKCFLRLSGVTILKNILVFAGLFLFIIPGIYLMILFLFAECAILDKGHRVMSGLRFSRTLTNKKRGEIFKIELFCNLIIAIFVIILLSIFSSNNIIVFQYILLFTLSICTLIELKLIAYLYADAVAAHEGGEKAAVDAARAAIRDLYGKGGGGKADGEDYSGETGGGEDNSGEADGGGTDKDDGPL